MGVYALFTGTARRMKRESEKKTKHERALRSPEMRRAPSARNKTAATTTTTTASENQQPAVGHLVSLDRSVAMATVPHFRLVHTCTVLYRVFQRFHRRVWGGFRNTLCKSLYALADANFGPQKQRKSAPEGLHNHENLIEPDRTRADVNDRLAAWPLLPSCT